MSKIIDNILDSLVTYPIRWDNPNGGYQYTCPFCGDWKEVKGGESVCMDELNHAEDCIYKLAKTEHIYDKNDMVLFGNFIRDNYYGVGSPKLLSYHPEKYPNGKIEDIFVIWSCENEEFNNNK